MNIVLLDESAATKDKVVLSTLSQIQHIQKVLGLGVGDTLKVGSLYGKVGTALITDVQADKIELSELDLSHPAPDKLNLTVVLALPRPKVLRRLIIDMTAIGVRHIVIVNSYRSDKSYWQSPMLNRIDEFVLEGLQQSIDTVPPNVTLKKRFKPYVQDELSLLVTHQKAVVAHPYAQLSFSQFTDNHGLPSIICIGAEGGWIDYEIELLTSIGCQAAHVGNRILRTEAAVNALCGRYI